MAGRQVFRMLMLVIAILFTALPVRAQQAATQKPFEPQVGQAGKDVVWVPTPQALVDKMLDMAKLTPQDFVMDLGSGDGRTVITAARRGARALGIEYNPNMVELSQKNAAAAGVTARATFQNADLFETDFSKAQVITMFLLPSINMKLRPKILELRPGTRIVSNTFTMEDWEADEISSMDGRRAYFWLVPANVMGNWTLETQGSAGGQKVDLTFEQVFQKLSGTVTLGPIHAGLREARLRGSAISFSYVDQAALRRDFNGRVTGGRMEGSFRDEKGGEGRWSATKK